VSDIQRADPRLKDWMIAPAHELDEVRQVMEAWNRGELERWIAEFAPDCEWCPTTEGGLLGESTPIRGHEGLRAFGREAHELWEHFRLEVTDLLQRGRLRILVGRWGARGRSSGVEIETPMFWVMERNDAGKNIWAKSFVDLDDALAAAAERDATIGAVPRD
jgi:ketosteroid isomerase-like protein